MRIRRRSGRRRREGSFRRENAFSAASHTLPPPPSRLPDAICARLAQFRPRAAGPGGDVGRAGADRHLRKRARLPQNSLLYLPACGQRVVQAPGKARPSRILGVVDGPIHSIRSPTGRQVGAYSAGASVHRGRADGADPPLPRQRRPRGSPTAGSGVCSRATSPAGVFTALQIRGAICHATPAGLWLSFHARIGRSFRRHRCRRRGGDDRRPAGTDGG